ncbi:class I SAM-dependent methyltransferase [Actinomycetes bacterium KLBMP 9759]
MIEHDESEWYADFFTELPNEFWRRAVPPEATEAEIAYVERHLEPEPGSRFLDVPCGSGRHTMALARRGYHVSGFDISEEALAHARRAAVAEGLEIELTLGDMRSVPRDSSVDAALCMGNSFGYFDAAGAREFVEALAGAVRPGGGLVIDFGVVAESILPGYTDGLNRVMETGDISVEATNSYEVAQSRINTTYRFGRGTEHVERTAVYHVRTCGDVVRELEAAGFTVQALHSGTGDEPFVVGSNRLLITALRR